MGYRSSYGKYIKDPSLVEQSNLLCSIAILKTMVVGHIPFLDLAT
ncbi:hypothetical protein [Helicobacter bizzozeronii]|nr:hypothetical protein [Helicobacter bizzozeronii]